MYEKERFSIKFDKFWNKLSALDLLNLSRINKAASILLKFDKLTISSSCYCSLMA